jgi:hypothetical protein
MASRITDADVEAANDKIGGATNGVEAYAAAKQFTSGMLKRLADLNHVDLTTSGPSGWAEKIVREHGWDPYDDQAPDGHGPCDLGRFESHSRRPWQCRGCGRRRIDHRPVN